jgi:hypothetical protein
MENTEVKRIVIDYDETQEGEDGESLDLFSYLENEFNNNHIIATIKETKVSN